MSLFSIGYLLQLVYNRLHQFTYPKEEISIRYYKIYFSPTGGTKKDYRYHCRSPKRTVYGNRAYEDTLMEMKDILSNAGFLPSAAITSIAEHSIMHCYAKGRPDGEDVKLLNNFADRIKIELTKPDISLNVPGNTPYREFGGVSLKPSATRKCIGCGICAKKCPTQAINPQNLKTCDASKCISCMQCIAVCPSHARKINPLLVFLLSKKMKKSLQNEKNRNCFYRHK